MIEETKEILDDLNKTADNCVFIVCRSQEELDQMPRYTSNFMSINDRQAKILLKYIEDLQQKVEQLENIRKEAIKATKDVKQFVYDELVDRNVSGATETHCKIMDLLNILNKGDNNGK